MAEGTGPIMPTRIKLPEKAIIRLQQMFAQRADIESRIQLFVEGTVSGMGIDGDVKLYDDFSIEVIPKQGVPNEPPKG